MGELSVLSARCAIHLILYMYVHTYDSRGDLIAPPRPPKSSLAMDAPARPPKPVPRI